MMKKISEIIIGLVTVFAIILGCAENPDGSCNLAWTLSCLAVAGVCGWVLGRYFYQKPLHITQDAYIELQRQIQDEVDAMDDEHRTIEIEAELPDDAAIYLTIDMFADTSESKFTDGAWGSTQTFTETQWRCNCEIAKVQVLDGEGKERESDFDESNLELAFETTDWK